MFIKMLLIVLVHLAALVAYPYTGRMGFHYLGISILLWCGFSFFIGVNIYFTALLNGIFGKLVSLAFFTALCLIITLTMPQRDDISVFTKLKNKDYPTRESLYYGLHRVGLEYDALLQIGREDFDDEIEKPLKKAQKPLKAAKKTIKAIEKRL